jgi:hypothetical protein
MIKIPILLLLLCSAGAIHAANPHSSPVFPVTEVSCDCDATTCTVSWADVGADSYGVDVEFEAEWLEGDVEMKASAELDLDDSWACDGGMCVATGDFVAPMVPVDAELKFVGKVKGLATGNGGSKPRDFMKTTGDCASI